MKALSKLFKIIGVILLSVVNTAYTAVLDDFNVRFGKIIQLGTGPHGNQTNQRFETTIPANSKNDPNEGAFAAYINTNCLVRGDFDIQVDYKLLNSPKNNGIRHGIVIKGYDGPSYSVERDTWLMGGDVYAINFSGNIISTPTSDRSGKLRIRLSSNEITGYFYNSSTKQWNIIGTQEHYSSSLVGRIEIGSWGHDDGFNNVLVNAAFDNINASGGVFCPLK